MNHYRAACAVLLCLFLGCRTEPTPRVVVFAAASTGDVLETIAHDFQAETGVHVVINPAASSTLAVQIEQGADADLFLSADEEWADRVAKLSDQRCDLLANRLVVVVPADNGLSPGDLADLKAAPFQRLAVAREGVPAGKYARDALRAAGVWDAVQRRTIEGGDVRATLNYVAQGEADAGFVYATDAAGSKKVRVAFVVPEALHQPIRYPLLLLRKDKSNPAARQFYDYLATGKGDEAFRRAGFQTLR